MPLLKGTEENIIDNKGDKVVIGTALLPDKQHCERCQINCLEMRQLNTDN